MSSNIIDLNNLAPEHVSKVKALTQVSSVSMPTVALTVVLFVAAAANYIAGFMGLVPLWMGAVVNSIVGYYSFSVIHDAIHRSIAKSSKLNDFIGYFGLVILIPYVNLRLFRWAHILHHRFANGERDPDTFFDGPVWSLPFRWMFVDFYYLVFSLRNKNSISGPALNSTFRRLAVFLAVLGFLTYQGYGMQVLMLWFVPSRIMFMTMGFTFFWLPHVPHDVTQEEDFIRATTVRNGFEGLMNVVLQYQNYHLIHHMYPMTPFYNNYRVYKLIEPELKKHEMAIQKGFAIHPTIVPVSN
jgi:beta-carotene hydroxylase